MIDIINALQTCLTNGKKAVIVTILTVNGSAYQRDGVRALIQEDGEIVGIISGGCVERDLLEHARDVLALYVPKQAEYDFGKANDAIWGFGLGCTGSMTLWFQPFDPIQHQEDAKALLSIFEHRYHTRNRYFCTTVIESEDTSVVPVGRMFEFEEDYMSSLFESSNVANMLLDGEVENVRVQMFAEHVEPRPTLLIYGAGLDALLLVHLAKFVDWRVVVADHRPHFISGIGFENADRVVIVARDEYGTVPVDKNTYVVTMTHNYEFDKQVISHVIKQEIPYIGQLGPKYRIDRILKDIEAGGILIDESCLEKLHAPVGLDIGASSPKEIALSVMSEVICRRNKCQGGLQRNKSGPLYGHSDKQGNGFSA